MLLIVLSAFFLLQKSQPPMVVVFNTPIRNAALGNIILSFGAFVFGVYLVNRIYNYFKT
jgi:hypothetical protein